MSNGNRVRGSTTQIPIAHDAYWDKSRSLDMPTYQGRIPMGYNGKVESVTWFAPDVLTATYLAEQYTSCRLFGGTGGGRVMMRRPRTPPNRPVGRGSRTPLHLLHTHRDVPYNKGCNDLLWRGPKTPDPCAPPATVDLVTLTSDRLHCFDKSPGTCRLPYTVQYRQMWEIL